MDSKDLNLATISEHLSTPEKARCLLETILWPDGPVCPHCAGMNAHRMVSREGSKNAVRDGLLKCRECQGKFTVKVGTIFEGSHIPLNKWLMAIFILCSAKKGISAKQLERSLGVTYKTAWFLAHRIRHGMSAGPLAELLKGTVEVDECYYGQKTHGKGFKSSSKSAVVALVERETGLRRSVVMERLTANTLQAAVREHVAPGATLNTDEHAGYHALKADYKHKTVKHAKDAEGKREYHRVEADGEIVTTNFAESSFSLLRRGVFGAFHHISRKHLGRYVGEFDFRWNSRKTSDGERTVLAIGGFAGKRLKYRDSSN